MVEAITLPQIQPRNHEIDQMSILVLYGSETGTAEDVAEGIRRDVKSRNATTRVMQMDYFDTENLPDERVVIVVVSTSGQGEMPSNTRTEWRKLLRKSLPGDFLQDVKFAVIGLGDSSYQKYNFAAKKIYRRLIQLGASPIVPLHLADDQHEIGIDGALIPFKKELYEKLSQILQNFLESPVSQSGVDPKYSIVEKPVSPISRTNQESYPLEVVFNRRATAPDHFQDTRFVRFATKELDVFEYSPGDVLMLHPYNLEESVDMAISALGYSQDQLDASIYLSSNDPYVRLPPDWLIGSPTTIRKCLHRLFDLQQIPRRTFFEVMSKLSPDEMEKERLEELASPERLDEMIDYCTRPRRTIAEVLRDFPATSKSIPLENLFDLLPTIRPRAFSIASSSTKHQGFIDLIVARVEYKSRMADPRRGICSNFIARLKPGDTVLGKIRRGTFKFPPADEPVICVGPGTGIAPFRSLLNSREDYSPAPSLLFFGCRGPESDYYFADEWAKLQGVKTFVAFSRVEGQKMYVQHLIKEKAPEVWSVMQNGKVFIAGSSGAMPKEVGEALDEIAAANGQSEWLKKAEATGRIQYETWS